MIEVGERFYKHILKLQANVKDNSGQGWFGYVNNVVVSVSCLGNRLKKMCLIHIILVEINCHEKWIIDKYKTNKGFSLMIKYKVDAKKLILPTFYKHCLKS